MSDDPRAAEIAALRKQLAGLSAAADVDPRDLEIAWLRDQVQGLADAIARSTQPPKPREWVSLPSGQCIPADLMAGGYPALHAEGFRWDGDKPVFPDSWPKVDPGS